VLVHGPAAHDARAMNQEENIMKTFKSGRAVLAAGSALPRWALPLRPRPR
jgi:hypothetical protein